MSKAAKTRAADQRKKLKRSKKLAQQALYEGFKSRGANQKKKGGSGGNIRSLRTTKHSIGFCGNFGCEKCFPDLAAPRMNDSNDPRVRFRTIDELKSDPLR